jgi:hypothetical protein
MAAQASHIPVQLNSQLKNTGMLDALYRLPLLFRRFSLWIQAEAVVGGSRGVLLSKPNSL